MATLAKALRVARGTVQNRIDRLEANGTIVGYTVRLERRSEAHRIRALTTIAVEGNRGDEVLRALRGDPAVRAAHHERPLGHRRRTARRQARGVRPRARPHPSHRRRRDVGDEPVALHAQVLRRGACIMPSALRRTDEPGPHDSMQRPATTRSPPQPRVLFVPVSGPNGSGELMRCLIVARELRRAAPGIESHFLVSRHGVFRDAVDFPVHDCDDSPTRSTPQVLATIAALRPDVVVFDNAGRTEQLRAAKKSGARLVFTSRSPRLRWKAFRVTWLRLLDEHWIVFPKFVTGGLSAIERLKLRLSPGYCVRHLDTLFTPSTPSDRASWLAALGLQEGGTRCSSRAVAEQAAQSPVDPSELFIGAADRFARETGQVAVVLTGRVRDELPANAGERLRLLPRVRPEEVQHLLAGAARVVSNGGTSLIHALAHAQPIVAVALANDQNRRIRRAARLGVVIAARAHVDDIARAAARLVREPSRADDLRARARTLGLVNGVDEAVTALQRLARA